MPRQISFDDVVLTPETYLAWQAVAQKMALWLDATGVHPQEMETVEEQLELLDDGQTLRIYVQLPGERGEVSLNIPAGHWAWAPNVTN